MAAKTHYTLTVVNDSNNYVDFCVYQSPPDLGIYNLMTLAWLTKAAYPTTSVVFDWTIDYSFVWSNSGPLAPGAVFHSSQNWPADPSGRSAPQQVVFGYGDGAYTFKPGDAVANPRPGNLYIREDNTIPMGESSVGIGMSGAGTFAVPSQPNQNLMFTPHPEYWITAGTFTPGQVLDEQDLSDNAALQFPPGVFALTATLNADNTWTVASS